jgi:hypothetical protein
MNDTMSASQGGEARTAFGNAVELLSLCDDAFELSHEDFEARYGSRFLLLHTLDLRERQVGDSAQTRSLGAVTARSAGGSVLYPVRRREGSTFDFIAVGRNEKNDVHIPDPSISRFHSFFREDGDDLVILDAKSANGTWMNGERVPRQGEAEPLVVPAGATLRFGDVSVTLVGVETVIRMASRPRRH